MKHQNQIPFDNTLVLLTPKETARRLSIKLDTLRTKVNAGNFPTPRRIGRSVRFVASEVSDFAKGLPFAEVGWRGFPDEDEHLSKKPFFSANDEKTPRDFDPNEFARIERELNSPQSDEHEY